MPIGLLGAAAISGGISLLGGLMRPRRDRTANRLLTQRLEEIRNPDFMRNEFLDTARQLAPSQSDILGRLRASGLGMGNASVLANQQFKAQQNRATTAGAQAFSQFTMQNQSNINNVMGMLIDQRNQERNRRDSFNNQIMGGVFGGLGQIIGSEGFNFGGGGGGRV